MRDEDWYTECVGKQSLRHYTKNINIPVNKKCVQEFVNSNYTTALKQKGELVFGRIRQYWII